MKKTSMHFEGNFFVIFFENSEALKAFANLPSNLYIQKTEGNILRIFTEDKDVKLEYAHVSGGVVILINKEEVFRINPEHIDIIKGINGDILWEN